MRKLCERPGCGAPADVSYGIDNSTLTVWVDNRAILEREQAGRLCRRHADALVVPRGWTIDDRRQPIPQLFRVVDNEVAKAPARAKAARQPKPPKTADPSLFESVESAPETPQQPAAAGGDATNDSPAISTFDPDETQAIPWSPRLVSVDDDDDDEAPVFGRLMGRAFGKKNNT